jgi:CDP-diacylglycerol--inositol 3-phosphatidyltransferase
MAAAGYARVILAIVAFYYMPHDPVIAGASYMLSAFLDAFDGYAARLLDQGARDLGALSSTHVCRVRAGTKFGAVLDMVTDRCGTMCLMVTLAQFYPHHAFTFQMLMALDIGSHWIHMFGCVP